MFRVGQVGHRRLGSVAATPFLTTSSAHRPRTKIYLLIFFPWNSHLLTPVRRIRHHRRSSQTVGASILQGQVASASVRSCCSNYCCSGQLITLTTTCSSTDHWSPDRMTFTSGVGITGYTTNSVKRMQIRTTLAAVSSSRTSAGCSWRNIRKSNAAAKQSTSAISSKTPSSSTSASTSHEVSIWNCRLTSYSRQVLRAAGSAAVVLHARLGRLVLLGRIVQNSFLRGFHLPLRLHAQRNLASQLSRPHLGQSSIRPVSTFLPRTFMWQRLTVASARHINPAENKSVAFLTSGEGWHNYHHVFPWDYKAAELGNYRMNMTTAAIDFFSWLGVAYDRKTVPASIVRARCLRTGDGSHPYSFEDSPYANGANLKEEEKYCEILPSPSER